MFNRDQAPVWAKYGYDQVMGVIKSQDAPIQPENVADYVMGRRAALIQITEQAIEESSRNLIVKMFHDLIGKFTRKAA